MVIVNIRIDEKDAHYIRKILLTAKRKASENHIRTMNDKQWNIIWEDTLKSISRINHGIRMALLNREQTKGE